MLDSLRGRKKGRAPSTMKGVERSLGEERAWWIGVCQEKDRKKRHSEDKKEFVQRPWGMKHPGTSREVPPDQHKQSEGSRSKRSQNRIWKDSLKWWNGKVRFAFQEGLGNAQPDIFHLSRVTTVMISYHTQPCSVSGPQNGGLTAILSSVHKSSKACLLARVLITNQLIFLGLFSYCGRFSLPLTPSGMIF